MRFSMHGKLTFAREQALIATCPELAARRTSSRSASTSQPSRTVTRSYREGGTGNIDQKSEAKAVTLPWSATRGTIYS
jgi:hypothetical protein